MSVENQRTLSIKRLQERSTNTYPDKLDKAIVVLLSIVVFVMSQLSFNMPIVLILIFLYFCILTKCGIDRAIPAYIFITFWGKFTSLPVFSGVSIISLLLAFFVGLTIVRKRIKIRLIDFVFVLVVIVQGLHSVIVTTSPNGLMLSADAIVACYISTFIMKKDSEREEFWNRILYYIYVSAMVSIAWGIISYLRGDYARLFMYGNYIPRFKATIGTDRSCILYCGALVYCLFIQKNRIIKYLSIAILVYSWLMSFSITAIVCLFVVGGTYILYSYQNEKSKAKLYLLFGGLIVLAYIVYVYNFGSRIGVINTIVQRFQLVKMRVDAGEASRATSGRTDLWKSYLQGYREQDIFKKLFGSGYTTFIDNTKLNLDVASHNTYLDMILYFGIVPFCVVIYKVFRSIFDYRKKPELIKILMLKEAYLIIALGVSMLTNEYFWLIFIM